MAINAPHAAGLQSVNLRNSDVAGNVGIGSRGVGGFGQGRIGGAGGAFDGESVLAADAWEGEASRSLGSTNPSDFADGPDLAANVERDVDFILSVF